MHNFLGGKMYQSILDDLHYYYLQDKTKIKGEDKLTLTLIRY